MIPIPSGVRVWLATGSTDMRRGFPGLSLQVQEVLRRDPLSGYLFCFRVRRGNLLEVIWHGGQDSEFVSRDLDLWAYTKGVTLDFSRPGKPTDNAYIEAFNGRFRAECLNSHWFLTLADAAEKMEDWRRYYNEKRPHDAIGNKAPISLINPNGAASPSS